ncbi:HAD family hydrolase [Nitrincola sp. A-D6]|uniref:haloacid dehalogenase type II n=1 Tax=Nitrincola sp. A-D6 TaxID=1545442 RepID=UPI00051FB6FE|nr:haloacid dehalogenase type II [Nitrincola sp. A-D6]KGK42423.1 HAD family hydrolase [Nitrincola sp. A-D6]
MPDASDKKSSNLNHITTLFFDVNETLLDIQPLKAVISKTLDNRQELADLWFISLLHHSLVDTASGGWHTFAEIGNAVLNMLAAQHNIQMSDDAPSIAEALSQLPPHADVIPALSALQQQGFKLVALTNSSRALADKQLNHAGIMHFFDAVLSVESIKTYKPDLKVYCWATEQMDVPRENTLMIAAHSWDVGGAKRAGMHTAFIARKGQTLSPLLPEPDLVCSDLNDLAASLGPTKVNEMQN